MKRSRNKYVLYGCLFLASLIGCQDASSPGNNPLGTEPTATSPVTIVVNGQAARDVDIFQNEQKTFTVIGNYVDCTWYVNGTKVFSGSSYTFDAGSRFPGEVCEITVTVTDAVTGEKRSGSTRVEIQ